MAFLLDNGQVVTTHLTANCSATATAAFDLNDSTTILFYNQQTPIWAPLVSTGIPEAVLTQSLTVGGVTLVATDASPFNVTFNAMGADLYTVLLTGSIIDGTTTYPFVGQTLGTFTRSAEMKSAVKALRMSAKL